MTRWLSVACLHGRHNACQGSQEPLPRPSGVVSTRADTRCSCLCHENQHKQGMAQAPGGSGKSPRAPKP